MAELDDTHRGTMAHPGYCIWAYCSGSRRETGCVRRRRSGGCHCRLRSRTADRRGRYAGSLSPGLAPERNDHVVRRRRDRRAASQALETGRQWPGRLAPRERRRRKLCAMTERAMTKDFNCGHAAKSGVIAAMLAREGFTGPTDVLGKPALVLLVLYGGSNRPERLTDEARRHGMESMEVAQKAYSACRYIHASLDAILALQQESALRRRCQNIKARILKTGAALVERSGAVGGQ